MFLKEFNTLLEKAHVADRFRFGDSGNAERLVARFGENLRFDLDRKKFVIWNDSIWKREDDLALLPLTKEIARSIDDPDWAQKAESAGARNAMITLTKGERTIWARLEDFDKHPMLLNVKNGTLDLETGNLRSFCREDFMTLQCPVEFDEAATCPKFDKFLQFICNNDKNIIHDLCKALGYTLTGKGSSHVFFMLLGGGANGKTQLIEILSLLLGSGYSQAASMKLFAESKGGFESADYAFANFFNARLVHAAEPKRTATLNENRLKEVSGGDTISVRQIYEREFEYKPTWKLWMMMNHDPRIVGTDEGIWRRVRVVRFAQTVPENDRIEDYGAKLFNEEGPGILNRLLKGVRDWKAEGLPVSAFGGESLKYRSSQDAIQRFIDECCVIGDQNIHVKCGTLYDAFAKWARTNHEPEFSLQAFSQTLESKYPKKRVHDDGEHRFGIGLKDART
jgi:putative DNA primase/helicase